MNYKIMICALLLMPVVSVSNTDDINAQIEKLIELRSEKEQELSKLGKVIAERQAYIQSIHNEDAKALVKLIIEQAGTSDINNKNFKNYQKEFKEILLDFGRKIDKALDSNTFQQFFYENIKLGGAIGFKSDFDAIKFSLIRIVFENMSLVNLIEKYVSYSQNFLDLDQKINDLQNQLTLY